MLPLLDHIGDSISTLAGHSTSVSFACVVDVEPLDGVVHLAMDTGMDMGTGVRYLAPDTYAIDARTSSILHACFEFPSPSATSAASVSGIAEYKYWLGPIGTVAFTAPETIELSDIVTSTWGATCADIAVTLVPGSVYILRIAAVTFAGVQSRAAEATLVPDTTVPLSRSEVVVHTGMADLTRQASDCCVAAQWPAWIDQESKVTSYSVCFSGTYTVLQVKRSQIAAAAAAAAVPANPPSCVDVGMRTRVVIEDACECAAPSDWLRVSHTIPIDVEGATRRINFIIHANNTLRMQGSSERTLITIDPAPNLIKASFDAPTRNTSTLDSFGRASICGTADLPDGALVHRAGHTVLVRWQEMFGLSGIEGCLNTSVASDYPCVGASASATSITFPAPGVGVHNVSLRATSLGGANKTLFWTLVADDSPPVIEVVEAQGARFNTSAYWSLADSVTCSWEVRV